MRHRLGLIVCVLASTGCGEPTRVAVPASHPANPDAASAPVPPPSTVLALPADHPAGPAADRREAPRPAAHGAYACPMHPEVTSDQPGTCPICHMALVPTAKAPAGGP